MEFSAFRVAVGCFKGYNFALFQCGHVSGDRFPLHFVVKLHGWASDDAFSGAPPHLAQPVVHIDDRSVLVLDSEPFIHGFNQPAVTLLTLPKRLLRLSAFGDLSLQFFDLFFQFPGLANEQGFSFLVIVDLSLQFGRRHSKVRQDLAVDL